MGGTPTILAFDTSAAHCAAALLRGGRIVDARRIEMGRGQAEALMPLLAEVLEAADLTWHDLDAIGVGTGPGNFTGIRIAVSAARGLALGLGVPAIGVTGFEALAHGVPDLVLISLPAPRDAVYLHRVEAGRLVGAPIHASPDDLPDDLDMTGITRVQGHEAERIGRALGLPAAPAPVSEIARGIALCAADRLAGGTAIMRPAPLYIRPADAAPPSDPPPVILP